MFTIDTIMITSAIFVPIALLIVHFAHKASENNFLNEKSIMQKESELATQFLHTKLKQLNKSPIQTIKKTNTKSDTFEICNFCGGLKILGVCQQCASVRVCSWCNGVIQPNNLPRKMGNIPGAKLTHGICLDCKSDTSKVYGV